MKLRAVRSTMVYSEFEIDLGVAWNSLQKAMKDCQKQGMLEEVRITTLESFIEDLNDGKIEASEFFDFLQNHDTGAVQLDDDYGEEDYQLRVE